MTNADVIRMIRAGLSEQIIVSAVQDAPRKSFDVSVDGLLTLKSAGATDAIILAMQGRTAPPVATAPSPTPSSNPAPRMVSSPASAIDFADELKKPREAGLYFKRGEVLEFVDATPVRAGGVGAGSLLTSGLTMGIKKTQVKAEIQGSNSDVRVSPETEFYFFGEGFNANDFALARLQRLDGSREIVVASVGLLGGKAGLRDEDQVETRTTRVSPGIYRVVPMRSLRSGEYGFVNLANDKDRRVWSFGVDNP